MAGAAEPRVNRALDEVQDVHDAAIDLATTVADAAADGVITPEELAEIVAGTQRVRRETDEAVVSVEWTRTGQLIAVAGLTGKTSAHALMQEAQVNQRALALGMNLHA